MIQSSYSLAFNGKALLNNSKEMLWQRDIYQVTTSTDGHGSITASPMSGFSGTNVSLSNTPNPNYSFTGYSVTGATLTGNQFTLNNDVTAHAGFYRESAELFADSTYRNFETGYHSSYQYNVNLDLNSYNYCTVCYHFIGTNSFKYNTSIYLNNWNWRVLNYSDSYTASAGKCLRYGNTFTATNANVSSKNVNNNTMWFVKNIGQYTWVDQLFILDRANGKISAAIDNTVYGYGNVTKNITSLDNIYCETRDRGMTISGMYVNGFNSLTAINDYYGLH